MAEGGGKGGRGRGRGKRRQEDRGRKKQQPTRKEERKVLGAWKGDEKKAAELGSSCRVRVRAL